MLSFFILGVRVNVFSFFLNCDSRSTVSDSSFLGDPIVPFSEGKDGNSHLGSRFIVI